MGQTQSNGIIGARRVATGPAATQPRASAALTAAGRALLLGLACGAAAYALARSAQASATTGHGPDALVAGGVLAIGALAAAWLALGCAALLLRALLAPVCRMPAALDRVVTRATPRLLRRVVTAGVGAGIAAGALGLPAIAVEAPPPLGWQVTDGHLGSAAPSPTTPRAAEPTALPPSTATVPAPGPAPDAVLPAATSAQEAVATATTPQPATTTTADATTTTAAPDATPAIASPPAASAPADAAGPAAPAPAGAPRATVVVRAGDCLWSIAAAHLPTDASDADIAAAWPAWYAANAATIGPDPDLLVPGQVLAVPQAGAR